MHPLRATQPPLRFQPNTDTRMQTIIIIYPINTNTTMRRQAAEHRISLHYLPQLRHQRQAWQLLRRIAARMHIRIRSRSRNPTRRLVRVLRSIRRVLAVVRLPSHPEIETMQSPRLDPLRLPVPTAKVSHRPTRRPIAMLNSAVPPPILPPRAPVPAPSPQSPLPPPVPIPTANLTFRTKSAPPPQQQPTGTPPNPSASASTCA